MAKSRKKRTESEWGRDVSEWRSTPVPKEDSGEEMYCSCCVRPKQYFRLREMPSIGEICLDCWLNKPPCSVDGCDGIAVERGLCRDHFINSPEPDWYNTVDRYGGLKDSAISHF